MFTPLQRLFFAALSDQPLEKVIAFCEGIEDSFLEAMTVWLRTKKIWGCVFSRQRVETLVRCAYTEFSAHRAAA